MERIVVELENGTIRRVLSANSNVTVLVIDRDTGGLDAVNTLRLLGDDAGLDTLELGLVTVASQEVEQAYVDAAKELSAPERPKNATRVSDALFPCDRSFAELCEPLEASGYEAVQVRQYCVGRLHVFSRGKHLLTLVEDASGWSIPGKAVAVSEGKPEPLAGYDTAKQAVVYWLTLKDSLVDVR